MAGALGASAAVAGAVGAVVGGAIVGAASGAVIQMGSNLIDGKNIMEGVGQAALVGAIGGALGGAGGALGQGLGQAGKLGAGMSQSLGKFGIETAFDVTANILGDLVSGKPLTLEGIMEGAAQGVAMSLGMNKFSKIKGVEAAQTKFSNAGANFGNSFGGKINSGLGRGVDVPTGRGADVDMPSVKPPAVDVKAPQTEVKAPGTDVKPPETTVKPPQTEVKAPEMDVKSPEMEVKAPQTEVKAPPTQVKPPQTEVKAPETQVKPPETNTPNGRTTHADEPEVEPGVVAKEKAADGHDIKVLKDGRVVRCSECGEIRNRYANELEQNPHLKQRLDEIEKIADPQEKARQAQQLEQELAQIAKTMEQRATLKDPNAIDFFDQKFRIIVGDGNNPKKIVAFERYLDATAKRGDGDLEKGLLEDYRKANKPPEVIQPRGEMVSELPRLRQEAENLKGEIAEWLKTNNIKGGKRLIKPIDDDLNGVMTNMEKNGLEASKARIEGFENNLKGVRSEFEQAKTAPPGTEIGAHVKFEGKDVEIDQIRPDGTWINVKNYQLFGLNNPKINDLIKQAEMNLRAAEANLVNGIPPTVVFDFSKGVTPEVAQRLRAINLNGRHIQVTGKEIPLPQSN
jgi:hypothetical protein